MTTTNPMSYDAEKAMEPAFNAVDTATNGSGISMGKAACYAGGALALTTMVVGLVRWGVKMWQEHHEEAELRQPEGDEPVEPTDDQLRAATE